jgi:predicted ArsR family transcriptional regulator
VPEPLDVLGDAALRGTLLYVRLRDRPVTAAQTAAALGVHRTVARSRLERLASAGLLVPSFERRPGGKGPGGGRPAKTYAVAPETEQVEFPPRRYDALLAFLIDSLPRRGRTARLREAGVAYGVLLAQEAGLRATEKAGPAFERICRALRRLGFHATVETVSELQAVLTTQMCPLRPMVVTDAAARELDRGMWSALVAQALSGARVSAARCETYDCGSDDSPCRIVIDLRRSSSES